MADGLNKVMLIGNLGADPELKYTQGNQAVARLRLATTESYLDRNGTKQQRTAWHSVTIWGKRAEALSKILEKGRTIYVEGRLDYQQWEDKEGQKRTRAEIIANEVILLGGGRSRDDGERRGAQPGGGKQPSGRYGGDFPPDDFDDGDIPF